MVRYLRAFFLVIVIVCIDQVIKLWVRNNMALGEEIEIIPNRFIIHFTENNGMAYGLEFGGEYGKLALSLFRIVAVGFITYGLYFLIKKRYHKGLIFCVSLILAGALGNIIDSTFYGVLYGYSDLFHGKVVDMFYFPLLRGVFPNWLPIWGGEDFLFFRPVFNFADAAITVGVAVILLFQKIFFAEEEENYWGLNDEVEEC